MSDIPTRRPTNNQPPQVTINNSTASDRLLEFVDEQIEKMRKYTTFSGELSFYDLNQALSGYSSINCSLIAMDVMAKEEYQNAKNAYDEFVAEKYAIIRSENNPSTLAANKWLSTSELMMLVQIDKRWNFEYKALRDEMNSTEKKVAFCRRLLENWSDYKFNIGTISKNIQAEVLNLSGVRALGIEQN